MFQAKRFCGWRWGAVIAGLLAAATMQGQSVPSAFVSPRSLWAGVEYADMKAGFPHGSDLRLSGVGVFANFNWNHSIGVEGRARFLNFNSWYGETEQDYLAGPRYTFLHSDKWRPYASFQVGMAKVQYPFKLGSASFLAMTPGGGLEYRVGRKWSVQASYEYQILPNSPNFSNEPKFGIRPNGPQVGISYRLR